MLPTWTSDSCCNYHVQSISFHLGLTHDRFLLFEPGDFSLVRGSITGLIGTNGSGKTSLAKVLVSKELPGFPPDLLIQYLSSHENYTTFSEQQQQATMLPREYMYSVIQDRLTKLDQEIDRLEERLGGEEDPQHMEDIANELAELYQTQEDLQTGAEREIEQTLHDLGFGPYLEKNVSQLSCGWQYKCRLVAAFTSRPDILIMDEPSFLDAVSIAWLIRKTRDIAKTANAMVLIISHKEALLNPLCDRILYINSANHALSLHNHGYEAFRATQEMKTSSAARVTKEFDAQMQTAEKSLKSIQDQLGRREKNMKKITMQNADKRFIKGNNKESKQKADQSAASKLKQLKQDASAIEDMTKRQTQRELVKPLKISGMAAQGTLALFQDVTFAYDNGQPVLWNMDAQIEAHDHVLLCGENGCGKSTFLQLLIGTLQATKGTIIQNARVLYFPQTSLVELTQLHGTETPVAYLGGNLTQTQVRQHLGDFGLADTVFRPIISLSAGQRVRLWLAKRQLELSNPSLLILDEVSENLDANTKHSLLDVLNTFVGAVIVVSHDKDFSTDFKPNLIWRLKDGRMHIEHI